jgi:hypothetical protein
VKESLKSYFNDFHCSRMKSHHKYYQFVIKEVPVFEQPIAKTMKPYAGEVELLIKSTEDWSPRSSASSERQSTSARTASLELRKSFTAPGSTS